MRMSGERGALGAGVSARLLGDARVAASGAELRGGWKTTAPSVSGWRTGSNALEKAANVRHALGGAPAIRLISAVMAVACRVMCLERVCVGAKRVGGSEKCVV